MIFKGSNDETMGKLQNDNSYPETELTEEDGSEDMRGTKSYTVT